MKKTFLLMMLVLAIVFNGFAAAQGAEANGGITMDEAKKIALEKVKGKVVYAKTEDDDGRFYYEIIIQDANNAIFEVEVDKVTGKILEVEKEDGDDGEDDDDDRYDD
ncbi:MAG TPA: PepSY domain-containing protein [Bacillus bacterium]|nr:PepSY domain-containing protein [Bacillus sp. (in: firmicutes)]